MWPAFAVTRCGEDADESSRTMGRRNVLQFPQQARVVGIVGGVGAGFGGLVGGVASRVYAGRSLQSVHLQAGIVGDHDFSRNVATISLRFLARVGFEGQSIFDDGGQGRELRNAGDLNSV